MTSTESERTKGLQEKIVETIFSYRDDGLDMISNERNDTYEIYLDRQKIMTFSERKRTIRLEEKYMFLPESLRILVDDLREIRYSLEEP